MLKNRYSVVDGTMRLRSAASAGGSASPILKATRNPSELLEQATAAGSAKHQVQASSSFMPTGASNIPMSVMPVGGIAYNHMFTGLLPEAEESLLPYYRDCYYYDSVAGSAVDLSSNIPFSDWTLTGLPNEEIEIYSESLARLNMRSLLPEISNAYLVDGAFIGSLVYDPKNKAFQDVLIHDRLNCAVTLQPFFSVDPIITANTANYLSQFYHSNSPYVRAITDQYPKGFLDAFMQGAVVLDPVTTIYIPRRGLQNKANVSYLKRVLPAYMFEKIMFRGTLLEASKRMRSTSHVKAGDDVWEPTIGEMQTILQQFQATEMDPLGAWVITRNSVEVNEIRCLAGSSLINTAKGLIRIDSMVDHDPETLRPGTRVDLDEVYAKGHNGSYVPVKHWWYQGKKPIKQLVLSDGTRLKPTANHKFLTLKEGAVRTLVKVSDITKDTWLLKPGRNTLRTDALSLNLEWPDVESRPSNWGLTLPEVMTPELAYCLALIISEGYIREGTVSVVNSDKRILTQYESFMTEVFGLDGKYKFGRKHSDKNCYIRGEQAFFKKTTGIVSFNSKHLVNILEQLGLSKSKELRTEKSPSYLKKVPWSILQADHQSQLGFISGYLDGDGTAGKELRWRSTSQQIIRAIHAMLGDMGYQAYFSQGSVKKGAQYGECSTLHMSLGESSRLRQALPFNKKLKSVEKSSHDTNSKGIPAEVITSLLLKRDVSVRNQTDPNGSGARGSLFLDDDGNKVFIAKGWKELFKHFIYASSADYTESRSVFSYVGFDEGRYDKHLSLIKRVSADLYENVQRLISQRYVFCKVVQIKDAGLEHTYDLTMDDSAPPLFTVNNVISKNSGGDFWKWTDVMDTMVPYKLRALGISEAFLSGDTNYSNSEAALSIFMDNMDSYRQFVTYRLFSNKIFPLIAVLNGLFKDPSKIVKMNNVSNLMRNLNNQKNLKIPEICWHKSLRQIDTAYTDMLDKLTEKGLPIPLKMWAAAANVDITTLLSDVKEDAQIREAIKKIKEEHGVAQPEQEGDMGFDGGFEESSTKAFVDSLEIRPGNSESLSRRRPLASREFSAPPLTERSKSGKVVHAVYNENAKQKQINENIVKAMKALNDPNVRATVRKRVVAKVGRVPNIMGV